MSANMGGGVLTFPAGQRILLVGGSATGSVFTGRATLLRPGHRDLHLNGDLARRADPPAGRLGRHQQ